MAQNRDVLGWLAMGASVVVAAQGEWSLAVACHFGGWVAAALPVAIDAYAIRAMQTGREVLPAVLLMIATNAASHLHRGDVLPVSPWLVVAVSAIAPLVLWRVHALRRPARHGTAAVPQGNTPAAEPVPPVSPTPAAEPAPAPASPLVICGGHLEIPAVPPRPRLDASAARAAIEQAWREGRSIRDAAKRATRSVSQVQRVYTELDATRPIEGQTEIAMPDSDAA
jgi:hypothetical protein